VRPDDYRSDVVGIKKLRDSYSCNFGRHLCSGLRGSSTRSLRRVNTMTTQEQMSADIRRWSAEKLSQWFNDSVMRYQLVGLSKREAESEVLSLLTVATAGALATRTTAPIMNTCLKFAEVMAGIRRDEGLDLNLGGDYDEAA
jgi:hypothetical protein